MRAGLPCTTNFVEGGMTVFPSITVSEPAVAIDAAAASETTVVPAGIKVPKS